MFDKGALWPDLNQGGVRVARRFAFRARHPQLAIYPGKAINRAWTLTTGAQAQFPSVSEWRQSPKNCPCGHHRRSVWIAMYRCRGPEARMRRLASIVRRWYRNANAAEMPSQYRAGAESCRSAAWAMQVISDGSWFDKVSAATRQPNTTSRRSLPAAGPAQYTAW